MGKGRKSLLSLLLGLLGFVFALYLMSDNSPTMMRWVSSTPESDEEILFDTMLQVEDMPSGWYRRNGSIQIEYVPDGDGRFFWFHHISAKDLTWVNVSEKVLVYGGQNTANEGYQQQRDKYFPPGVTEWEEIEELVFPHHADEMKVACLEGYVNGMHHYACRAVARYERVVIIVQGNVFDERWLTMEDFRSVLEAADRRATIALRGSGK